MNERLDTLERTLKDEDFVLTREVFGGRWQLVKQKTPYLYAAYKKISQYTKPLTNLGKQHYW